MELMQLQSAWTGLWCSSCGQPKPGRAAASMVC